MILFTFAILVLLILLYSVTSNRPRMRYWWGGGVLECTEREICCEMAHTYIYLNQKQNSKYKHIDLHQPGAPTFKWEALRPSAAHRLTGAAWSLSWMVMIMMVKTMFVWDADDDDDGDDDDDAVTGWAVYPRRRSVWDWTVPPPGQGPSLRSAVLDLDSWNTSSRNDFLCICVSVVVHIWIWFKCHFLHFLIFDPCFIALLFSIFHLYMFIRVSQKSFFFAKNWLTLLTQHVLWYKEPTKWFSEL